MPFIGSPQVSELGCRLLDQATQPDRQRRPSRLQYRRKPRQLSVRPRPFIRAPRRPLGAQALFCQYSSALCALPAPTPPDRDYVMSCVNSVTLCTMERASNSVISTLGMITSASARTNGGDLVCSNSNAELAVGRESLLKKVVGCLAISERIPS